MSLSCRRTATDSTLRVLERIQRQLDSFAGRPQRGAAPPELLILGIDGIREVFFKPYRIIYHVQDRRVIVNAIADGRRDLASLLHRRLIQTP